MLRIYLCYQFQKLPTRSDFVFYNHHHYSWKAATAGLRYPPSVSRIQQVPVTFIRSSAHPVGGLFRTIRPHQLVLCTRWNCFQFSNGYAYNKTNHECAATVVLTFDMAVIWLQCKNDSDATKTDSVMLVCVLKITSKNNKQANAYCHSEYKKKNLM